jgi:hypothetical protein
MTHILTTLILLRARTKKLTLFSCLVLPTLLIGCNHGGLPGLAPAAGVVTLNGVPVDGATISFAPTSGNPDARSAAATTDKEGKFVVTTLNFGDGILPGEYQVLVTKTTGTGGEGSDEREGGGGRDDRQIVNHVPLKYANKTTSDLSVSISPKGDKNIELKLEGEVDLLPRSPGGQSGSRR